MLQDDLPTAGACCQKRVTNFYGVHQRPVYIVDTSSHRPGLWVKHNPAFHRLPAHPRAQPTRRPEYPFPSRLQAAQHGVSLSRGGTQPSSKQQAPEPLGPAADTLATRMAQMDLTNLISGNPTGDEASGGAEQPASKEV